MIKVRLPQLTAELNQRVSNFSTEIGEASSNNRENLLEILNGIDIKLTAISGKVNRPLKRQIKESRRRIRDFGNNKCTDTYSIYLNLINVTGSLTESVKDSEWEA
jgi:hypothetical protein